MTKQLFTSDYQRLLLALLEIPTTSPMETSQPAPIAAAQATFAAAALESGFEVVTHAPPPPSALEDGCVPLTVREQAARMGPLFLESQPNLLLRLGPPRELNRTLMFNFHMDTVAGDVPIGYRDGRFSGRGAVDMKGPGVGLLAGIAGAWSQDRALTEDITILIQCVSGEEGGAMGVYGTRVLAEAGFVGQLNIFAEPSAGVFFDQATTSMTARIDIQGHGATDDEPQAGQNATLLLGYIAQYMGRYLAERIYDRGGKLCIAGINTGTMHNRVYGSGSLLMNLAYNALPQAQAMRSDVETTLAAACAQFRREFENIGIARKTAATAVEICKLTWLKQGLPVLTNRDPALEHMLARTGLIRNPEERKERAFTCDAIWVQGPGMYTVVFGPGNLGANGAHTEDEFIELVELETYAQSVAAIVRAFQAFVRAGSETGSTL